MTQPQISRFGNNLGRLPKHAPQCITNNPIHPEPYRKIIL